MVEDDERKFFALLDKLTEYSDDDIAELWRLSPHVRVLSLEYQALAHLRASLVTISAIRRFDKASADLINTTNRLTKWVLGLTLLGVLFAGGSLWLSWLALQKP